MSEERKPTADEARGMIWWNNLSERERARWLRLAGSAVPAAAWHVFKETGVLRLLASGRWAIVCIDRDPRELSSGEVFRLEVDGELKQTRMEFDNGRRAYYALDDYPLRDGLRAAIGRG